jgi:hypothetical protein
MDYYRKRYINHFVLKTSDNLMDDYEIKIDFDERKGGFVLVTSEIEKKNRANSGIMASKTVDMFNMDEFKAYLVLKSATRDSKKTRANFLDELMQELTNHKLIGESA